VTASGFSPGTNDDHVQDATGAVNVYRSTTRRRLCADLAGQNAEVLSRIGFLGGRLRSMSPNRSKTSSPTRHASPGPAPSPVDHHRHDQRQPEVVRRAVRLDCERLHRQRIDPGNATAVEHVCDHIGPTSRYR
jgi:hypothetical protein